MENRARPWVSNNTILLVSLNAFAAVCTLLYLSTFLLNTDKQTSVEVASETIAERDASEQRAIAATTVKVKPPKRALMQPTTHISYLYVVLDEITLDVIISKRMCRPEDITNPEKHRIPKANKSNLPKAAAVVYIAVGLLLASLGAAILELYKAKKQINISKNKPPLARRCSLADLTVLRHTRKENMRRDSVFSGGSHDSSGPMRLLGGQHSSLLRRCSFPVTPREFSNDCFGSPSRSRRTSYGESSDSYSSPTEHRHYPFRIVRRH